jgi:predicted GIY-YIG superfamily endonuclease
MAGGYIYILGSYTGMLYIGVTRNLYLRIRQVRTAGRSCSRASVVEKPRAAWVR